MRLHQTAAALVLLAAAPLFAQDDTLDPGSVTAPAPPKAKAKKSKAAPAATPAATPSSSGTAAPSAAAPTPAAPALTPAAPAPAPASNPLDEVARLPLSAPITTDTPLDLPEPKEEVLAPPKIEDALFCVGTIATVEKATRASASSPFGNLQKIFADIARDSPLLKKNQRVPQLQKVEDPSGKPCSMDDTACLNNSLDIVQCDAVLMGKVEHYDNGYTLDMRVYDKKFQVLSQVHKVITTQLESDMEAWTEGQACNALKVRCVGLMLLDADKPELSIKLDDNKIARKPNPLPGKPERYPLKPGLYHVYASAGKYNSPRTDVNVAVRNNTASPTVFLRQSSSCEVSIYRSGELKGGANPPPSGVCKESGIPPVRVVGIALAGLGVVAEGFAAQQFFHSQSLANSASSDYNTNGYYKAADLSSISSARTAHTNSTIFTAVGAGLIVVGGVLFFVF